MVQIFNNEDIMFLIFKSAFFPINQTRLLSKVSLMYLQISWIFLQRRKRNYHRSILYKDYILIGV